MKKILKTKQMILILFCLILSVITITVCSKNSFLYPFNNWVDENAFMTVGKSWYHGLVPYKDIFEQKGPLLYLIFMISYIISNHSFIGVYLLELLNFTICLYYVSKIIKLYLDEFYIYIILPLFSTILISSAFFLYGGSAEEFCFPMLSYMLYSFCSYHKFNKISKLNLFLNGLIAGCVAMIKFNLLGFWLVFMASIFISKIINKEVRDSFISCIFFLMGMFIPIAGFIIYFYLVHGLEEFINVYFLFNTFGYGTSLGFIDRIETVFRIFFNQITKKFIIFNLIYVGLIYFIFSKRFLKNIVSKLSLLLMFVIGGFGIYFGCLDFNYYFLIPTVFILFGLLSIFKIISDSKYDKKKIIFIPTIIIAALFLFNSRNIFYMKESKEVLPQYKFAKIINDKKDAKLLNYGFLDGGFYMAADLLPSSKYFQELNAYVPGMYEELDKKIKNSYFDFVIVRTYAGHDSINEILSKNYKEISKAKETIENIIFTYHLYEKK